MRLIATEEAFATTEYIDAFLAVASTSESAGVRYAARMIAHQQTAQKLCDIELRMAEMDAGGVDVHLMSLVSPGVQIFDADRATHLATKINDDMAALIRRHPDRLAGLGAIAPQDPIRAAAEIDRAINVLGLNGVIINSHTSGEFLDDTKFEPILAAAQKHRAPIYIHPTFPPDAMIKPFERYEIHGALWGFAAECGLHAVRMVLGGVFDRFPNLQVVLGHMGEGVPYFLFRLDNIYQMLMSHTPRPPGMLALKRKPSDYIKSNIHITTSGMFWPDLLDFAIKAVGPEQILFAVDYPFESSRAASDFIVKSPISATDKTRIASGNAERLFRIGDRRR
jgi:2,3-dihydroxybenzoate decarboxylase